MPWRLIIHRGWCKWIYEVHLNKRIGFRGAEDILLEGHHRKRKAWYNWQRKKKKEAWRDGCDGYVGRIHIVYNFEGNQGGLRFAKYINFEFRDKHMEETGDPQYGGSHLTELVSIKSASKNSTSLFTSMGGYFKKKKKKRRS